MLKKHIPLLIVTTLVVAALAVPAVGWWNRSQATVLHARMPEEGGWSPSTLRARAGEPLQLRLTSDDVVHSFAVGRSDFRPVDISPGETVEVTLTFEEPGTYTFYCTRWCGPGHWRMRGTITVTGEGTPPTAGTDPPLYLQLGLDLDEDHLAENLPTEIPSARRGAALAVHLLPDAPIPDSRSLSPSQAWQALRADPLTVDLTDQQVWDLAAYLWQKMTTPETLSVGQNLYQRDCAACHGISGDGEGVFQSDSPLPVGRQGGLGVRAESPTDFTDPAPMLGANPALLQGKLLRGGMGTGMPSWGLIYTEEQTWTIIDYLWTFQFDYEE